MLLTRFEPSSFESESDTLSIEPPPSDEGSVKTPIFVLQRLQLTCVDSPVFVFQWLQIGRESSTQNKTRRYVAALAAVSVIWHCIARALKLSWGRRRGWFYDSSLCVLVSSPLLYCGLALLNYL